MHELDAQPSPAWESAWLQECEDRMAAIDSGEMKTYDFDEILAEAGALLKLI